MTKASEKYLDRFKELKYITPLGNSGAIDYSKPTTLYVMTKSEVEQHGKLIRLETIIRTSFGNQLIEAQQQLDQLKTDLGLND